MKYLIARFEGKAPSEIVLEKANEICGRVELPLFSPLPKNTQKLSPVLPRAIYDSDMPAVKERLADIKSMGITSLTVPNISVLPLCVGFVIHGDYPLNVCNSETLKALAEMGFKSVTISPETASSHLKSSPIPAEYIVYGRMPLMYTENCIIQNIRPCRKEKLCKSLLKDDTGAIFPMLREYKCRNIIYNSVPTWLLDKKINLSGHIMMFTTESDGEILQLFDAYIKEEKPKGKFTRGKG